MKNANRVKRGKIDISELNVPPEKHEYETAKYFADRGFDVIFIKPSDIEGVSSPDFEMARRIWETKSPIKFSKSSFEDNFKKASKQSENLIFDLRRLNREDEKRYRHGIQTRKKARRIKTLLVISKDGRLLTEKGFFDTMTV